MSEHLPATTEDQQPSGLAITSDQTWWTPRQDAALEQIGIGDAPDGDKLVFLHVCRQTGLDPFARQIHMVSRNQSNGRGGWEKKWTIQTGIDGLRLVADRADRRDRTRRTYDDTLWADSEGNWHDVWTKATAPAAAKVVLYRNGNRYPATVLYREYVQTKRDGSPTGMWERMPANQLAKCAEAQALRKAYPQDLSSVYADDEMGQADRHPEPAEAPRATVTQIVQQRGGMIHDAREDEPTLVLDEHTDEVEFVDPGEAPAAAHEPPVDQGAATVERIPVAADEPVGPSTPAQHKMILTLLDSLDVASTVREHYLADLVGRPISEPRALTKVEATRVVRDLSACKSHDDLAGLLDQLKAQREAGA